MQGLLPSERANKPGIRISVKVAVCAILILLMALISYLGAFGSFESYYEDITYQHGHGIPSDIKIIAVDGKTLEKIGPYASWDRSYFADIINKLYSDGSAPLAVGIDTIFSGHSEGEGDRLLLEAASGRNIVLASKINVSTHIRRGSLEQYVSSEDVAYDELNAVTSRGFTNAILDDDGYLRRSYTTIHSGVNTYDSFAVAMLKAIGCDYGQLPSIIEISYSGNPGDFEVISMMDVLNGTVPASHFSDSIVLLGAYDDGLMDSYSVPITHKNLMYGVEIQANTIQAIRNGLLMNSLPYWMNLIILVVIMAVYSVFAYRLRLSKSCILLAGLIALYVALCYVVSQNLMVRMQLLYVPVGLILLYVTSILVRYVETQRRIALEMKQTLFSMADSMAEAIEGRTPYNANHTKNVARRSVEMMEFINKLHKQGKTELSFTNNDIDQMYLAAMLHDIGKMDVPLEVMDKPTKLGHNEQKVRDRLELIKLYIKNDILSKRLPENEGMDKIKEIDSFVEKISQFNCGKPLSEDEVEYIRNFKKQSITTPEGKEIPFLTGEEADDLMITAGTLSDKERIIMQSHVEYTDKILSHVHFGRSFNKVNSIASNHHELLNGKGYPKGMTGKDLDVMTRILTIMDIYDSLIADDRPYKKPKTNKVAFEILDEEAEAGKIDKDLLEIAKKLYLEEQNDEG